MRARAIIGIAALVCVSTCGVMGALVGIEMADQVNRKLPQAEQFDGLGSRVTFWRLRGEYRRLYPEGHLTGKQTRLVAIMIPCALIVAWSMGFFRWLGI
jgi:hypothetical protein